MGQALQGWSLAVTAVLLVLGEVMIMGPSKVAKLKKTWQLWVLRLVKFRGIVTRTHVLVKKMRREKY